MGRDIVMRVLGPVRLRAGESWRVPARSASATLWRFERVNAKSGRFVGWLVILTFVVASSLIAQQAAKSPGASIFHGKCVLCHGADGSGKTALGKQLQAADLRSKDVQKHSDAELHKIIHDGEANMPAFADQLSDTEIDQVLKHVRALGKTAPAKK